VRLDGGDHVDLELSMLPVMNFASEELKRHYLPKVASGEFQASYCLSEADAGSDVAAMRCRATRDGDDYILSGRSTGSPTRALQMYTVFATVDPERGAKGVTCFLVEKEWGVQFPHHEDKMGLRTSRPARSSSPSAFPAPTALVKRARDSRLPCTPSTAPPTIGAQAVGIAQAGIDCAGSYMKERRAFGGPIANLQGLRFMLADMAIRTEAARALVYRACSTIDAGDPDGTLTYLGRPPSPLLPIRP
jgi:acyl-CoA dehydrogenase